MLALIAALPILFTFVALIVFKKPSEYVAPLGWLFSAILAWAFWGTRPSSLAIVSLAGVVWAGAEFVWGVFGAFFFLNFLRATGLLDRMVAALATITGDSAMKAILVMFSLAMFLGAVAPAGSAFVIAGSILLGGNMPPLSIAAMGMFGNGSQSPYGLLGVPVDVLARPMGLPREVLSIAIAELLFIFVAIAPLWMVLFLPRKDWRRGIAPALIVGLVYGLFQYLTVRFAGPELANIVGGLAAIGVTAVLARWRSASHPDPQRASSPGRSYLVPFLVLIALILATRSIPALKPVLGVSLGIDFKAGEGITETVKFKYLSSAGTMALASVLISMAILRIRPRILASTLQKTLGQMLAMAVAICSFAAMAHVMKDFGMNTAMAQAMVEIAGRAFPLVSPLVGMLGTAITGSTTASNMFFGGFQIEVARRLGLSGAAVGASQVIGCTAGEIICPFNALVVTSGLGMKGQEGEVMRRMVPSTIVYALLTMAASFIYINYLS